MHKFGIIRYNKEVILRKIGGMAMELTRLIFEIFRKRYERETQDGLKPFFYRVIGVNDEVTYHDALKTLQLKYLEHQEVCLFFEAEIPLQAELELIDYIYKELEQMNSHDLAHQEINIFDDLAINHSFLQALDDTVKLATANEQFFSESVRNNFITKLIVWTYSYVRNLSFDQAYNPKCFYYGSIARHEIYFLILLYKMGFDVLYLNPVKEAHFEEIDTEKLSVCQKELGIALLETFEQKAERGTEVNRVETMTKTLERDIHEQLFNQTGMYKPWQFRSGTTKALLLDTIVEDLYTYWKEPSRLRDGFKTVGNVVYVPCFFYKIDGVYRDKLEYRRLVQQCVQAEQTLFFNSGSISSETIDKDAMYQLMFCQLSDGSFDLGEVSQLPFYQFHKYSEELQEILLQKFNETIQDENLFAFYLEKETMLQLLYLVLNLNEDIIRLIDNFDYTSDVPKLVIYLDGEEVLSNSAIMLLGYLHKIGLDIVIFNPSGLFNVNKWIKSTTINIRRLDTMDYESSYKNLMSLKQSVLSRFLNR